jgi:hypothetical protein
MKTLRCPGFTEPDYGDPEDDEDITDPIDEEDEYPEVEED